MSKTILITGSTDGIGLETAKMLLSMGHQVLIHGRNPTKLKDVQARLEASAGREEIKGYVADLSSLVAVKRLASDLLERATKIDVLINNAGVYMTPQLITVDGFDTRFAVNTLAPYLLMQRLRPLLGRSSRVINLSSAAQSPVDLEALAGRRQISDPFTAYAQSKLALTMWSCERGRQRKHDEPVFVAVNPGSMLGTKMVKDAFGVAGGDIAKGAKILVEAALSESFESASGKYFDNDSGRFARPHPDAMDPIKTIEVVRAIETILTE